MSLGAIVKSSSVCVRHIFCAFTQVYKYKYKLSLLWALYKQRDFAQISNSFASEMKLAHMLIKIYKDLVLYTISPTSVSEIYSKHTKLWTL